MGGRPCGTEFEMKANRFLKENLDQFVDTNLYKISIDTFSYLNNKNQQIIGHNMYVLPKDKTKKIFLLTAHYDHIHPGSNFSKEILKHKNNKVHPGADDNASGVVLTIELFRLLTNNPNIDTLSIIPALVLFSGHEDGLFGSKYWVKQNIEALNIDFVLNFDMIGRMDSVTNLLTIRHQQNDTLLPLIFVDKQILKDKYHIEIKFRKDENLINHSDAGAFVENKIQAYTISTGIHEEYHKISDTADKLNYHGMYRILICFLNELKSFIYNKSFY